MAAVVDQDTPRETSISRPHPTQDAISNSKTLVTPKVPCSCLQSLQESRLEKPKFN